MKMHSIEEKPVLKAGRIFSISFLLIFLVTSELSAQIPLNGFCGYQEFTTSKNQTRIFPIDINSDGWRDFILSDQVTKKFSIQTRNKNIFSSPGGRFTSVSFYDLIPAGPEQGRGRKFAFISRKEREAGFVIINRSGIPSFQLKKKYESYPSSMDLDAPDKNGKSQMLVSGSSFKGLSLLKEERNKLTETLIDNEQIYSCSRFFDLDYDGYQDIVALNLLRNSLILFYNDRSGNFRPSRSIGLQSELKQFSVADFNSNGFNDLVFTTKYGFEVLLGDSVSSFEKRIVLNTPLPPDRYTILDFNGDGFNDVAYINIESGKLFISYAKSSEEFFPYVTYFQKKGLVDLSGYIDRDGRKLAVLNSEGRIYQLERITESGNVSIALGLNPSIIGTYDLPVYKSKGIFFVDKDDLKINFLESRKRLYDTYFSIPVAQDYKNVVVDEISKDHKTFYFYSEGEKLIELLRIGYPKLEFSKRFFYANGPIYDLKITSDRVKDRQTIFLLSGKDRKLFIEQFEFRDFRYLSAGVDQVAEDVMNAALSFNLYKEIFHFNREKEKLSLLKSVYNRKVIGKEILANRRIPEDFNPLLEVKSFNDRIRTENTVAAFISLENNTELSLFTLRWSGRIKLDDFNPEPGSMIYLDDDEQNSLFLYDRRKGKVRRVNINIQSQDLSSRDVFESKTINSYIVDKLNNRNEFFIYTDSSDNLIKIEQIK